MFSTNRASIKAKSQLPCPQGVGEGFESKSVFEDSASTFYAESVSANINSKTTAFALSDHSAESFGKNTTFTNDIHDATKKHPNDHKLAGRGRT